MDPRRRLTPIPAFLAARAERPLRSLQILRTALRSPALQAFVALLAAGAALLAFAVTPAAADAVTEAGTALQTQPIYVQPGATVNGAKVTVDNAAVSAAFGGTVKVAVFADGLSKDEVDSAGRAIESALGTSGRFVLAVFSGRIFQTDSNLVSSPGPSLQVLATAHKADLLTGNYTATLVAWAQKVVTLPRKAGSAGNGNGTVGSNGTAANSSSSSGSGLSLLAGVGGVAVLGGGALLYRRRRKAQRVLSDAKANVVPYYDRLANEVNTINTMDNREARQAMADASERYTSAGSQMATAATVEQWRGARRATLEGLQAAALARKSLGLPPGPDIPPIDEPRGDQLTQAQQVTVQGQQVQGYPSYTPGAPYYYGGGGGYLGGWYSMPFWETMLLGSMIGGGGGWGGGGGYDSGYNSGYEAGQDNANSNTNDNGGGDGSWGGFGGGGGGDGGWGGFGGGGGGDFGGGGGGGSDGGSF